MKILSTLLIAASVAPAATTYTATSLNPPGATIGFANVIALNNKGEVLGDACPLQGGFLNCGIPGRSPAVWSNGTITPLPIPTGYSYVAVLSYYAINDSGTVVGTLQVKGTNESHIVVWKNGIPSVLPDAQVPGACVGAQCTCSPSFSSLLYSTGSVSFGLNAAGHVVGATAYPPYQGGGQLCSSYWVYDGSTFRLLPIPIPSVCKALPKGYYPGVGLGFGASVNDADVVMQTLDNFFCGPPYIPPPGFPSADPFLIQTNGSTSFLPLGSLAAATGTSINDVGDVLGYYGVNGGGAGGLVFWDKNGIHNLGLGGYAHMNQVGQVVYTATNLGSILGFAMWQNGVSTPIQLPSGVSAQTTGPINDAETESRPSIHAAMAFSQASLS